MPSRVVKLAGDIRTWVLLLAVVRLIGITDPPADRAHNWRQSTVLMVARNYHEQGIDLLHPRIDFAGAHSGITGMEFPLLNAGVAAVAAVFGWQDWYGRVLVLIACVLGLLAYHALVRDHLGDRIAFIATLLVATSLWFQYGRKTMPDVPALALVLIGLYALHRAGRQVWWYPLAWVAVALGVLMKSPAALLLVGVLPLWWPYRRQRRGHVLVAVVATSLLPAAWWYGAWVPHLERTYGFAHFFMGKDMGRGALELMARWPEVAEKYYFDALRFTGAIAFLGGLVLAIRRRAWHLLALVLVAFVGIGGLMLLAGDTFAEHSYYILPIVPFMALMAAYGMAALPPRWGYAAATVVALEGIANGQHDLFLPQGQHGLSTFEEELDHVSSRDDRIVINAGEVPTAMYFAHRKGWLATNEQLRQAPFRDSLSAQGCRFIAVLRQRQEGDLELPLEQVGLSDELRVYKLP